jgi:DnaJ-class molecular chaperone
VTDKRVVDRSHPSSVCPACEGEGAVLATSSVNARQRVDLVVCADCDGTGEKKT